MSCPPKSRVGDLARLAGPGKTKKRGRQLNLPNWLDYEVLGNSVLNYSLAGGIFLIVWFALWVVRRLIGRRLRTLAKSKHIIALDVAAVTVSATRAWFTFLIAAFIGSRSLDISDSVQLWTVRMAMVALLLQVGFWVSAGLLRSIDAKRQVDLEESPEGVAAMDILSFLARVAIWSVVLLAVLDNLGVNITTMIAGLGVGGIAVALAAQNILGDLFASLSIVLDKPFVVGDFLIIGEFLGTVEEVGIKTTRLRSLSGEQLVFSNNDLLNSRIRNYGRMDERRVVFALGVTYQTPADKLREIPQIIRKAVEGQADVRFDRAHFQKYGDFALIFEIVYYVTSANYNQYMDIQQAINLRIFDEFEAAGIEFAYPTRTQYVKQVTAIDDDSGDL